MRLNYFLITGVLMCMVCVCTNAEAFIMINEILADPPSGLAGDANGDGAGSTTQDEFIELYNGGLKEVDLTQWALADALKIRHVFGPASKLPAGNILVIFGGGNPQLAGIRWETATSGSLGLNNSADSVILFDDLGQIIQQVDYGPEAGKDESIVRSPEGTGDIFVLHAALPNADGKIFSPGYFINANQKETSTPAAIPELSTLFLLGWGSVAAFFSKRHREDVRVRIRTIKF